MLPGLGRTGSNWLQAMPGAPLPPRPPSAVHHPPATRHPPACLRGLSPRRFRERLEPLREHLPEAAEKVIEEELEKLQVREGRGWR